MLDEKTIAMIIIFVFFIFIFNMWRNLTICSRKNSVYEIIPPPPYEDDEPPSYEQITYNSQ